MARRAAVASLLAISTSTTSGVKVLVLRMTGSFAACGIVALLQTVRATLVPSTRTWSTARWSLSVANTATDNSGMTGYYRPFLKLVKFTATPNEVGAGVRGGRARTHVAPLNQCIIES